MTTPEHEDLTGRAKRWDRLASLLERASALDVPDRSEFLEVECQDDPGLRDELERLLGTRAPAASFLETPRAWQGFLRMPSGPNALVGKRIGTYRVLRTVASGGMGTVYEAEQESPQRRVALKVMLVGQASRTARRFRYEAEILARLKHPGIAQIYESGIHVEEAGGERVEIPWFAMEYVEESRTLLQFARERELDLGARLALILELCDAVGYGHEKGVIHRDIKPSNVLVDPAGRIKVIDFGIARARGPEMTAQTLVTRTGEIVGTLQYMSPEQIDGEVEALDVRSDVYAVGLVLYEILCGQPPYDLSSVPWSGVASRIRDEAPIPPRALRPDLAPELEWIPLKALEKEPARRYASARELADDIRRFLAHEPVLARSPSATYRLRKFVRRHALGVTAAALLLLAFALGTVGLGVGMREAVLARDLATRKADDVLALSAIQELKELVDRADLLWPASPDKLEEYERWLSDAKVLIDGRAADPARGLAAHPSLRDHQAKLAQIRARAKPLAPDQIEADRRASPAFDEWDRTRSKLAWMRRMMGEDPWPDETTVKAELARAALPADAAGLNALAWQLVDTAPAQIVYGSEVRGLALAERAVDAAADAERGVVRDTLAWALYRCGRFDEALAEEGRALHEATDEVRAAVEASQIRLREQIALWKQAGVRADRADEERKLAARAADLDIEVGRRRTFEFEDAQDRWWAAQLSQLVVDLSAFADEKQGGLFSAGTSSKHGWGIEKRLEFARTIRERSVEGSEAKNRWGAAIAAIAKNPLYSGTGIAPQLGLLPIGEDPDSHLWEFAHLQSGEPAERGADGKLIMKEETGLVLVLIPGGSFWMGAQSADPGGRNFDPNAREDESPVKEMTLRTFLLSKYEMTQGQWSRFAGANPSSFRPGVHSDGNTYDLTNPVEQVTWTESAEVLRRLDLVLPTEAQWEYGARGGTSTVWWTGDEKETLAGAANLADAIWRSATGRTDWHYEDWLEDGWAFTARVGSYRANAFGLHDVAGNVCEWCRDVYGGYDVPTRPGDGERMITRPLRIIRGGSFNGTVSDARSAQRYRPGPEEVNNSIGLRPARALRP